MRYLFRLLRGEDVMKEQDRCIRNDSLYFKKLHSHAGIFFLWFIVITIGILLLLFAVTFYVSPLNGEDYALSISWDKHAECKNFVELLYVVVNRSIVQFNEWNARFGEQLAIFWLAMPKMWFVVANTFCFAMFCASITFMGIGSRKIDYRFLIGWVTTISLCYLFWPRMEVFFWGTGAAEYLHPLLFTLLVIMPFAMQEVRLLVLRSRVLFSVLLMLAFIAGLSFENLPPAILVYMFLILCFDFIRVNRERIARVDKDKSDGCIWRFDEHMLKLIFVAVCYVCGWVLLMLAPSTSLRLNWYRDHSIVHDVSIHYLLERVHDVIGVFSHSSIYLVLILCVCIVFTWFYRRSVFYFVLYDSNFLSLCLAAILASAAVVFAPYTEARAFEFTWAVIFVAIIRLTCSREKGMFTWKKLAIFGLLVISSIGMAIFIFIEYSKFDMQVNHRTQSILVNKGSDQCKRGINISLIQDGGSARIMNNRESWVAASLDQVGSYFGCKVIIK